MNTRLDGKVALVTGGSRGIGRACALALAAEGATLAVQYRSDVDGATEVVHAARLLGLEAIAFQADLADPKAADQLVGAVLTRFGRVDVLVNNAGEMTDAAVKDMPDAMWDQTMEVNLNSAFRCTRACLPGMLERRWGRIINMTSQAAWTGSKDHAHYAASKAGLLGLTYSLAKEVGPTGITVNMVAPGRIATEMVTSRMGGREAEWMAQTPLKRLGEPEEIGSVVAFLASEAASYITGATLHVNGGMLMA
ncbi:MAG TPA: 3-oxoacyl-ACP reductase family protein [Aggregatilineales bacterium]|jgi:3-oxoacyl-[acyl-carrier protein] reductase|nr:3-oxoacyl-ACP reductase FabG [Anaerolineae bacterium]HUN06868.1 3-oxoacyl-ACP reductase family protein [Aggregatilineales bacterium]